MKPDTSIAMYNLIGQIQKTLPFNQIDTKFCSDTCQGCSVKLIDFLSIEMDNWLSRLENNEKPNFKDINKLAKMAKKIHKVLITNNIICK